MPERQQPIPGRQITALALHQPQRERLRIKRRHRHRRRAGDAIAIAARCHRPIDRQRSGRPQPDHRDHRRQTGRHRPGQVRRRTSREQIPLEHRRQRLGRRPIDQPLTDRILVSGIACQQGPLGDHIDQPRHPAGMGMDALDRQAGERKPRAAGHQQSVPQIRLGLLGIQRREVIARRDPLRQLAQIRLRQPLAQLRLAEQHDLQQLLGRGLQVGQQTHLFQRRPRQFLRLIDQYHHPLAIGIGAQQMGIQTIDQRLERRNFPDLAIDHPQFLADRLQQFLRRQPGVEHQGRLGILGQLLKQQATERGLAGPDLTGQLHETTRATLANPEQQVRQGIPVALAEIHEARVRGDRERRLLQAVELEVHGKRRSQGLIACHESAQHAPLALLASADSFPSERIGSSDPPPADTRSARPRHSHAGGTGARQAGLTSGHTGGIRVPAPQSRSASANANPVRSGRTPAPRRTLECGPARWPDRVGCHHAPAAHHRRTGSPGNSSRHRPATHPHARRRNRSHQPAVADPPRTPRAAPPRPAPRCNPPQTAGAPIGRSAAPEQECRPGAPDEAKSRPSPPRMSATRSSASRANLSSPPRTASTAARPAQTRSALPAATRCADPAHPAHQHHRAGQRGQPASPATICGR